MIGSPESPLPVGQVPPALDLAGAARGLFVDALAGELIEELERAGAGPILLKGASLADWLYVDEVRRYDDCDILIDPDLRDVVSGLLRERGFVALDPPRARRGLRDTVATAWARGGAFVDVHLSFWGVGVSPTAAWSTLAAHTERALVARRSVTVLTRPGRLVIIGLHAGHDGRQGARPVEDLERALRVASHAEWVEASRLARALAAETAFAAGLRLTEQGARMAAELELPDGPTVAAALGAAGLPVSDGYERLARAESAREATGVLFGELVPSREFMRWRYRFARRGRRGLLASYLMRAGEASISVLQVGWSWARLRLLCGGPMRDGGRTQP